MGEATPLTTRKAPEENVHFPGRNLSRDRRYRGIHPPTSKQIAWQGKTVHSRRPANDSMVPLVSRNHVVLQTQLLRVCNLFCRDFRRDPGMDPGMADLVGNYFIVTHLD